MDIWGLYAAFEILSVELYNSKKVAKDMEPDYGVVDELISGAYEFFKS